MDFGVHLPVLAADGLPVPVERMVEYAAYVEQLGFQTLAAHDHMVYPRPWLDGLTVLAACATHTTHIPLLTAVALPVVRGPVPLARTFTALDLLSGGRLIAGIGAGSSVRDYAAVGIPFEERWARFDESIQVLKSLWGTAEAPFQGRYYSTDGIRLDPPPAQPAGPPLWIGAWGSAAGLRRTARFGAGWIASAYNTSPATFGAARLQLRGQLQRVGKDPDRFPNALSTMALFITEEPAAAERMLSEVLSPLLNRPADDLRRGLLIGSVDACVETLLDYRDAGLDRVLLMPLRDAFRQLDVFCERVLPRVVL